MGYDTCLEPTPRLFAGLPHLTAARTSLLETASSETPCLRDFGLLYHARLELQRAVRAVAGRPLVDLPGSTSPGCVPKTLPVALVRDLTAVWHRQFRVCYGGSNQYGVPNYTFRKGDQSATLTGDGDPLIILEAFHERLSAGREMFGLVLRLFGELYLEEKSHDLFYYGYFEGWDADEIFAAMERNGIVQSAAEASERFGGDPWMAQEDPEIAKAVHELHRRYWLDYHEESIWSFDEVAAICFGHSSG